jgi:CDP-diglyceride synthetase
VIFALMSDSLTTPGSPFCLRSDASGSSVLVRPHSSEETVSSPRGEYLAYDAEAAGPILVARQRRRGQFKAFLQLNAVQRVLSAVVLAPLVTAFLWLSPAFATSSVCSFVTSACSYEYACLSNRIRLRILTRLEALEGVWNDEHDQSRCHEVLLRSSRGSLLSSRTAEEDAMSDRVFLSQSLGQEANTVRVRLPLQPSQTDLRSYQEEQEQEEMDRVDEELRSQKAWIHCHAVSELAARYFYGNDKLAAVCVSVVLCLASTAVFIMLVEQAPAIQSTEFYESRWFYAVATSYVGAFCACMAPSYPYAVTVLVHYGVFTVLTMYTTGCPLNSFSCGIGVDPDVAFLAGMLVLLVSRLATCHSGVEAFLAFMLDTLGLFYIAGTLSVLVAFIDDERRLLYRELLIALLYIVWASDTGAYVTGKVLELTKYPYYNPLAPHLSRNKDYEGTVGAIVFGVAAMTAVTKVMGLPGPLGSKVLFTIVAVITGRIGDLFESLLKRAAGVKDSGKLIPGHGGMLDRIDALMFATLVFSRYYAAGASTHVD